MAKRRGKKSAADDLVRRDGALVLTFINAGVHGRPRPRDYAGLIAWASQHGDLTSASVRRLELLAAERPDETADAFGAAEELHSLLSSIVNAAVDRKPLPASAVDGLNVLLARIVPRRVLVAERTRLRWIWPEDGEPDFFRPLWPVVRSATELLDSEDCGKVKRCAAEDCGLLFLSKGGGMSRKWCGESCSAPVRSRRYYRNVRKPRRESWKARWKARMWPASTD